jgi:hypothetical protein
LLQCSASRKLSGYWIQNFGTEQVIWDVRDDGPVPVQYNCNFFDIGPDGKITRMVVWMSRHESQK